MPTQDSRIRIKRSTTSGVTPTIPASSNHLDGSWLTTDLYIGEFFTNVVDERAWFRASAGLVELSTVGGGGAADIVLDAWDTHPYSAGDYVGIGGGSWTVDALDYTTNRYRQNGKTLLWNMYLSTTSIAGTVSSLQVTLPNSLTLNGASLIGFPCIFYNGSTNVPCFVYAVSTLSFVSIQRADGANFATGTNDQYVSFSLTLEIA